MYPNSCKGQVKFYGFFVLSGTLQIPVPGPEARIILQGRYGVMVSGSAGIGLRY